MIFLRVAFLLARGVFLIQNIGRLRGSVEHNLALSGLFPGLKLMCT